MRVSGLIFLCVVLLPGISLAQNTDNGGPPTAAPGTGVIRGHVAAAADGHPLARAEVDLFSASRGLSQRLVADEYGWFEFTGLEAGTYAVRATATGYLASSTRPSGRTTKIDLKDAEIRSDVDVALPKGGVIAVRVIDDSGAPVEGAFVQVQRADPSRNELTLESSTSNRQRNHSTDDRGEIRFYDLEPGDYYVSAGLAAVTGKRSRSNRSRLAVRGQTYYPGVTQVADATPVTLPLGEEIGLELSLPSVAARDSDEDTGASARGGVVVVHVTDETGNPRAGVEVRPLSVFGVGESRILTHAAVVAASSPRFWEKKEFYTDDRGDVRIYGLPGGEYAIVAQPVLSSLTDPEHGDHELVYPPIYYPGSSSPADAHALTIAPWDEVSLGIALTPGRAAHVRGRVERWDGQPGRGIVTLSWSPSAVLYPIGVNAGVVLRADLVDGEFRFDNVRPGDYVIHTSYEKGSDARDGEGSIAVTVAGEDISDLVLKTAH